MKINPAYIFLAVLAAERGLELSIARKNEGVLKRLGGREYGASFTRLLIAFHVSWFVSFALEATLRGGRPVFSPVLPIVAFMLLQAGRYWCISSLGRFWNTRIIVLESATPLSTGPYRLLRHPNYLIVMLEIFIYPALFGCWITSLFFGSLNLAVLKKRIRQEELALGMRTAGNNRKSRATFGG